MREGLQLPESPNPPARAALGGAPFPAHNPEPDWGAPWSRTATPRELVAAFGPPAPPARTPARPQTWPRQFAARMARRLWEGQTGTVPGQEEAMGGGTSPRPHVPAGPRGPGNSEESGFISCAHKP